MKNKIFLGLILINNFTNYASDDGRTPPSRAKSGYLVQKYQTQFAQEFTEELRAVVLKFGSRVCDPDLRGTFPHHLYHVIADHVADELGGDYIKRNANLHHGTINKAIRMLDTRSAEEKRSDILAGDFLEELRRNMHTSFSFDDDDSW